MSRGPESFRPIERQRLTPSVPDPLEGIIEGANRHERYRRFMDDVLSKIWPEGTESGEWGNDFHRTERFEGGNIDGYSQFSPCARDPKAITAAQFEAMVQNLGTPDYIRVISVPPQILVPDTPIVNVGGSCVIETHGVRTLTELKKYLSNLRERLTDPNISPEKRTELQREIDRYSRYLSDVARRMIDMAPTITHISGALLGGYESGVHLIESDMWRERIEKEYEVPHEEAVQIVKDAYQRIHEAVQRRSRLINPNSTLIAVNFDELGLREAIGKWLSQIGLAEADDYRVIEVIYTYVGPQQLDLLKRALQNRLQSGELTEEECLKAQRMLNATYHVRGKQVDHLRWGSMNLPKDVIMGLREMTDEEQEKLKTDVAYKIGVRLMQAVYRAHKENRANAIAVGFADLPTFGGGVQHEDRNVGFQFKGRPGEEAYFSSVQQQLTHPARLHRLNVNEHLEWLKGYTVDNTLVKKQLLIELEKLQEQVKPFETALNTATKKLSEIERRIASYDALIETQKGIIRLVDFLSSDEIQTVDTELQASAKTLLDQIQKKLAAVKKRADEGIATDQDNKDLEQLPQLIEVLSAVCSGRKPELTDSIRTNLNEIKDGAQKMIVDLEIQKEKKLKEQQQAQQEVARAHDQLAPFMSAQQRIAEIRQEITQIASLSYFPLRDNPFVHHAMQFLWDPDFVFFLKEVVLIQEQRSQGLLTKEDANKRMRELMATIYPKLEAYINYLYGRIDYPDAIRNSRVFAS